jgi:hypothetical protein
MSVHLHQRLKDIDTLTLGSASRRVVNFLLQERDPHSGEVVLQVSKRLVASKLGIQPETFSRILHRLVENGLIAMQRRNIRILGVDGGQAHAVGLHRCLLGVAGLLQPLAKQRQRIVRRGLVGQAIAAVVTTHLSQGKRHDGDLR